MVKFESSFSDELADRWDEYVDCVKRLETEAPFLRRLLDVYKNGIVVDAAMGLGCEAIYLRIHGFNVVGNEIDYRLLTKAKELASSCNVDLQTKSVDWRNFSESFGQESVDAVIILGNSLCLLEDSLDRERACREIFMALKPGGVFVVDQRNFDYMFDNLPRVLSGGFEYSSRIMYCQTGIEGKPTHIEPSRVRISCLDKKTGNLLGFFDVHPFRGNELKKLVQSVGFDEVDTYLDFHRGPVEHWDFATLVCHKPNLFHKKPRF